MALGGIFLELLFCGFHWEDAWGAQDWCGGQVDWLGAGCEWCGGAVERCVAGWFWLASREFWCVATAFWCVKVILPHSWVDHTPITLPRQYPQTLIAVKSA
ncbi:hypothetical protein [Sporosarcina sp.]|uniref:hypothetical protein n=1 Tax=Sporosarcina sp. TaxID=49982 RepID=UPI00261C1440|nr:hypothetical protein [Sporosarcina sp.]